MSRGLIIKVMTTAAITAAFSSVADAQEDYRFDVGGGIGMTYYLGDANTSNLWALHRGIWRFFSDI